MCGLRPKAPATGERRACISGVNKTHKGTPWFVEIGVLFHDADVVAGGVQGHHYGCSEAEAESNAPSGREGCPSICGPAENGAGRGWIALYPDQVNIAVRARGDLCSARSIVGVAVR